MLLVEDSDLVRLAVHHYLEELGHHVVEAARADEALRVFRAHDGDIDLLLADVALPGGMNGYQLARCMREDNRGMRAVFMSAYPTETLIEQGRYESGHLSLEKPFSIEQLDAALRGALSRDGPSRGPPPGIERTPPSVGEFVNSTEP